tara:strand:- start:108 stop:410 length:303 start_codon:yes stop_codon:yes gene_type:complete
MFDYGVFRGDRSLSVITRPLRVSHRGGDSRALFQVAHTPRTQSDAPIQHRACVFNLANSQLIREHSFAIAIERAPQLSLARILSSALPHRGSGEESARAL